MIENNFNGANNQNNPEVKYDVFLSYRRDGGESMAILLHDRLIARGFRVFLDVEYLNAGKFNEKLLNVIENCQDQIVILSEGALDRCQNEGDWLRTEIACALKNGKNVVPFILRNFAFPPNLPEDIKDIELQNGVNASTNEYFDAAIDRLCSKFLKSAPVNQVAQVQAVNQAPIQQVAPASQAPINKPAKKSKAPIFILSAIGALLIVAAVIVFTTDFGRDLFNLNSSKSASAMLAEADKAFDKENYSEALELYLDVIDLDRGQVEAYLGAARSYLELDKFDKAISILEKGLKATDSKKIGDILDDVKKAGQLPNLDVNEDPNSEDKTEADYADPNKPPAPDVIASVSEPNNPSVNPPVTRDDLGNGASNSSYYNLGLATLDEKGEWLYYVSDNEADYALYKSKLDGSDKTMLLEGAATFINLSENYDYVYFVSHNPEDGLDYICQMGTDGENPAPLAVAESAKGLAVSGGWVYILDDDDVNGLYRFDENDNSDFRLIAQNVYEFGLYGDLIYYATYDDELFEMNIDGSGKRKIADGSIGLLNVTAEGVYFYDYEYGEFCFLEFGATDYKIMFDGVDMDTLNVCGNRAYFVGYDETYEVYGLYRSRLNGTGKQLLMEDMEKNYICVAGGWIYSVSEDNYIYRISIDGSELQVSP